MSIIRAFEVLQENMQRINYECGLKINGFGLGEYYENLRGLSQAGLIAEIGEEEWMGRKSIVLNVRDVVLQ